MMFSELKEDKTVKNWLSGIAAKPNTRAIYTDSMRAYTEFVGKTPLELLEEAEAEEGLRMRERKITEYLREFREHLESTGSAPMTTKGRMTGVRSFYKHYEIVIPVIPRSTIKARPEMERKQLPTKDNFREILNHCDLLERAIILVGISSGLAVNDIANLKVRDFTEGYDSETGITTLHLIRQKVNYEFYTFLSPEASKAVNEYLDYRKRVSDIKDKVKQAQLLKQKIEYDKDGRPSKFGYLFIGRYIPGEYLTTKDQRAKEELRKLEPRSIQKIYRELNERAQKSTPAGDWNIIRSHNARKFFSNALQAQHAELNFVDFLLGHQPDGTRDAYFKADPKSLKREYMKYLPFVTIEKALDPEQHPDFIRLKNESDTYARAAANAAVERNELIELRAEIERIKKKETLKNEVITFDDPDVYAQFMQFQQFLKAKK